MRLKHTPLISHTSHEAKLNVVCFIKQTTMLTAPLFHYVKDIKILKNQTV